MATSGRASAREGRSRASGSRAATTSTWARRAALRLLPEIPGGDRIGLDSRHPVESARQAQGEEAGAGEELESVASTTGGVPDRRGQRVVQESVRLEEDAGRDVETIAADAECNGLRREARHRPPRAPTLPGRCRRVGPARARAAPLREAAPGRDSARPDRVRASAASGSPRVRPRGARACGCGTRRPWVTPRCERDRGAAGRRGAPGRQPRCGPSRRAAPDARRAARRTPRSSRRPGRRARCDSRRARAGRRPGRGRSEGGSAAPGRARDRPEP
jgi:hypothetical protein